ncbi:N-acetyltransferase [Richelia sinica FACHB-800]|nr:N-acetyltransferase [Richelia sinica FACHB-800]
MIIRCENSLDYLDISEINTLAFSSPNEAKLVELIRKSDRYLSELSLVAERDGKVVGHILYSYIDLVGQETFTVLGLAPLAVHPQFQRQGIGTALVKSSLEIANDQQEALVIVLGDPQFYNPPSAP